MFQITVIDKYYAKLIDAPSALINLLKKNNLLIKEVFINPNIISLIHEHFPTVLVTHLSRKAEIKRYKIPVEIQEMFNKVDTLELNMKEKELVSSFKDHASRQAGLSRKQYNTLLALTKCHSVKSSKLIEKLERYPGRQYSE